MLKEKSKKTHDKLTEEKPTKGSRCPNSPDGWHHSQPRDMNSIPACMYCGKII